MLALRPVVLLGYIAVAAIEDELSFFSAVWGFAHYHVQVQDFEEVVWCLSIGRAEGADNVCGVKPVSSQNPNNALPVCPARFTTFCSLQKSVYPAWGRDDSRVERFKHFSKPLDGHGSWGRRKPLEELIGRVEQTACSVTDAC
jgi:hypothetical protein